MNLALRMKPVVLPLLYFDAQVTLDSVAHHIIDVVSSRFPKLGAVEAHFDSSDGIPTMFHISVNEEGRRHQFSVEMRQV